MSVESPGLNRPLRKEEKELIIGMIRGIPMENRIISDVEGATVRDMHDGGMGSLRFIKPDSRDRKFGCQIYEGAFSDSDGVPVSITINVDQYGELFELDIFKADNSPLIRYPAVGEIKTIVR